MHHINQALRAHNLFQRDKDYMVKEGQVLIVDEFTGRILPGRRFSEGLHQALEAKENVKIENENQTVATITFQNYFRLYNKIAGMTGTATTEAEELRKVYDLEVVEIPTNKPLRRTEYPDAIYKTRKESLDAVKEEIKQFHEQGRPLLVGTISIERSEQISKMLQEEGIPHEVLNAKHHEKEARIVVKAGQEENVTIATQMAGRGTDIKLGEGVAELGGLHIIGVERHEARRIDNQLRGRAGRQGDPGSSRFYLSLEDDLMRIFGGSEGLLSTLMQKGLPEGEPISLPLVSRAIENAQKKVEAHNFDIRKTLLGFDDVMDKQREVIYAYRRKVLKEDNSEEIILQMMEDVVEEKTFQFAPSHSHPEEWNWEGLNSFVSHSFLATLPKIDLNKITPEQLKTSLEEIIKHAYAQKEEELGKEQMQQLQKIILLQTIDRAWKDHLRDMDDLRRGINLRGYGGSNPVIEYKKEAYSLFQNLILGIKEDVVTHLFRVKLTEREMVSVFSRESQEFLHPEESSLGRPQPQPTEIATEPEAMAPNAPVEQKTPFRRQRPKVGRNDPCPCGSGKKYKKCCGR